MLAVYNPDKASSSGASDDWQKKLNLQKMLPVIFSIKNWFSFSNYKVRSVVSTFFVVSLSTLIGIFFVPVDKHLVLMFLYFISVITLLFCIIDCYQHHVRRYYYCQQYVRRHCVCRHYVFDIMIFGIENVKIVYCRHYVCRH
jgi:hypothetical protein